MMKAVKQIMLAVLVFIVCLIAYNNYKHQITKRAFKKTSANEHLILLHKGGDEKLPATQIPRGSETMFGIIIAELALDKYALAIGEIYNVTLLSDDKNEPELRYYKTAEEAWIALYKIQAQSHGYVKAKEAVAEYKQNKQ